jgi:small GTP-binding protein
MRTILTDEQASLLQEERRILGALRVALASFGAAPDAQATLGRSIEQLDTLFLLVVIGEFNAGKSAVINALLGRRVVQEGVTPTTAEITMLVHDEGAPSGTDDPHIRRIAAGVDILRELHIVDTPGTNAIVREHEIITAGFVPRSDLVLFVTSADRPFTETERVFLEQTRDWGKKIVVAINKIDILETEDDIRQVVAFVAEQGARLLGVTPEIFPVSARAALRAKEGDDPAAWASSRFEALERYIHETLDEAGRLRLKLLNPLGVGAHLAERYVAGTRERLALLQDDLALLEDVERQLELYERDTTAQFGHRMAEVDTILLELERRGHDFFDETFRIGRVFDLLNRTRVQQAFERDVVGDAPQQIERKVNELVDWMIESDFRQWQAVTAHIAERRRQYKERIIDDPDASGFHLDRTRLLEAIGGDAQRVVDTYDKQRESRALADGARNAVAAAAATGVSALGLGTLVSVAATTAAADVTGIVMASALAGIGFFIIPARRRRAKAEMREKISALRARLSGALRDRFRSEIQRSGARIREGVAPYSRFVRAEREKLQQHESTLEGLRADLDSLKRRIGDAL